ncbi:MAG: zinc ribbon domain-containing protein [Halobacteria archaeon]
MGTHRSRFSVSAAPESLYEWARAYFEGRGFSMGSGSEPPRILYMRRGNAIGRHRIEQCRTELQVTLEPEGTEVGVDCRYDLKATDLLMGDHDYLENEVEGLRRSLLARGATRKCAKCGNPLAPEFQVCPYCGEKSAAGPPSCPGCGKSAAPEFNFCPACGTALREKPISLR